MTAEEQLLEVRRVSDELERLRRDAASPAVASSVRGALIQLHLAAQFLGDDAIGCAFELDHDPGPTKDVPR